MAKKETLGAAKKPLKQAKKKNIARKKRVAGQQGRVGRIVFGVLVGLAALAIVFFIWARAQNELSVTENAVGSLVSPVQNAVNTVTIWVRDRGQEIRDRNQLRSD